MERSAAGLCAPVGMSRAVGTFGGFSASAITRCRLARAAAISAAADSEVLANASGWSLLPAARLSGPSPWGSRDSTKGEVAPTIVPLRSALGGRLDVVVGRRDSATGAAVPTMVEAKSGCAGRRASGCAGRLARGMAAGVAAVAAALALAWAIACAMSGGATPIIVPLSLEFTGCVLVAGGLAAWGLAAGAGSVRRFSSSPLAAAMAACMSGGATPIIVPLMLGFAAGAGAAALGAPPGEAWVAGGPASATLALAAAMAACMSGGATPIMVPLREGFGVGAGAAADGAAAGGVGAAAAAVLAFASSSARCISGGATPIMVPLRDPPFGAAAGACPEGACPGGAGAAAAGAAGAGAASGLAVAFITIVPLNRAWGALAPRSKPHWAHLASLSAFLVPQFGQNTKSVLLGGSGEQPTCHGPRETSRLSRTGPAASIGQVG